MNSKGTSKQPYQPLLKSTKPHHQSSINQHSTKRLALANQAVVPPPTAQRAQPPDAQPPLMTGNPKMAQQSAACSEPFKNPSAQSDAYSATKAPHPLVPEAPPDLLACLIANPHDPTSETSTPPCSISSNNYSPSTPSLPKKLPRDKQVPRRRKPSAYTVPSMRMLWKR